MVPKRWFVTPSGVTEPFCGGNEGLRRCIINCAFMQLWCSASQKILNPRLTGGGVWRPPSRIFAIAQKRTALSTWNLAGLLIQHFDIVRGNFFEIRRKFFEIWSILWRHYTPLLVENWLNFAGLWKTQFLMKTQMKNTKRRKMRSSTKKLARFFKILGFWPLKFQKIDFFGKWSLKSKIFKIFKKPEHMLFIY